MQTFLRLAALALTASLLLASACDRAGTDDDPDPPAPSEVLELTDCHRALIAARGGEGTRGRLLAVRAQLVRGEPHYWLHTGAMAYDGTEAIVDAACETVCTLGGFRAVDQVPPCTRDYDGEAWVTLWGE